MLENGDIMDFSEDVFKAAYSHESEAHRLKHSESTSCWLSIAVEWSAL